MPAQTASTAALTPVKLERTNIGPLPGPRAADLSG